MTSKTRAAWVLAFVCSACLGSGAAPPPVVDEFFQALLAGDLKQAYELTTLPAYEAAPGFALTRRHFEAFYQASPLEGFNIVDVFRQEERATVASQGTPFFTVDVDLRFAFGTSRQSVYVQGRVLPKVEIEPAGVLFDASGGFPSTVLVDGVRTRVSTGAGNVALTVLAGEHDVTVDGRVVRLATSPLAVITGPARIDPGPPQVVRLTS